LGQQGQQGLLALLALRGLLVQPGLPDPLVLKAPRGNLGYLKNRRRWR
jgi:hypothetical protein